MLTDWAEFKPALKMIRF